MQGVEYMKKEKQAKSKVWLKTVIPALIGAIIGGLGGFFGVQYLDKNSISDIEFVIIVAGSILAIYLQLILHEAGHLIFGLLSGYEFVSFRVGSITIYKKDGKTHIGSYKLAGTGGQCLMAPPDLANEKIPYVLFNFGGVIINIVTSIVIVVVLVTMEVQPVLKAILFVFIAMGVFAALTNGIPLHISGIDNDGYNAVSLGKNSDALRAFWLQLKVNEMLTEGIRLKDMPEEWFEKPSEEGMQNNMIAALEAIRCNRLLDMHCFEEVNQSVQAVVDSENKMVGVQKVLLQIDQIFCEILGEKREEVIGRVREKELKSFMKAMKNFPSVIRTQYAYALLVKEDVKESAAIKRQFEKVMKKHPYQSEIESEWELIRLCEAKKNDEQENTK